jgi:hypothetical protein
MGVFGMWGIQMRLRIVLLAVWLVGRAHAGEPAVPLEPPQYDADPYYTDEFDALKACAARQAPSYQYDYDRPEVSAAEQVAAFLRRTCGKEIEALAKLVLPAEKSGGPAEMTGTLDDFIVAPFFDWGWASARDPTPPPGTSTLSLGSNTTPRHINAESRGPDDILSRRGRFWA